MWRMPRSGRPKPGLPGKPSHLSTDLYLSIRETVERICARLGVKFEDAVEIVGDRPGKDAAYLLDSTKARTNLGWGPKIGLDEGIEETVKWVAENFEELKKQPLDYIHKP